MSTRQAGDLISAPHSLRKPAWPTKHMPGESGIWLFILGDMLVFSLFFVTYLYYRGLNIELFQTSQTHLNQTFGALNTCFMLTSSWLVATAVHAARKHPGKTTPICFALALVCGLGFIVTKYFEYSEKVAAGLTLTTNDFFMYYYMFTGIHLLHVLIGMAVLIFMTKYTAANASSGFSKSHLVVIESGATFWHVVDLLWIVLFALLYLVK